MGVRFTNLEGGKTVITNQKDVRKAFWSAVRRGEFGPEVTNRRIRNYRGAGNMYTTDTRVAFVDWLDAEVMAGNIGERVAQAVTL